jgi:hypothetical protein
MGTPNAGRAESIASEQRRRAMQYREALDDYLEAQRRLDYRPDDAEIVRLRTETCALREQVLELRAALPSLIEAEVRRILVDELPGVIAHYASRRASHNGQAKPAVG